MAARKIQVPVLGGLRKKVTVGSQQSAINPGTTIAEFANQSITLAQLRAALGLPAGNITSGGGAPGSLTVGPGLTGGGPLIGNVPLNLTAPIPVYFPEDGMDGDQGPPGIPGIAGTKGERGPPGEDGWWGDDGTPGTPGVAGAAGPAGAAGASGPIGPPGDDGTWGADTIIQYQPLTINWATYTGLLNAPAVTPLSNILALNFGNSALSITESGTPFGAFYAGSGITVSGASDRNILMWGGTDTAGSSTVRTLTASGVTDNIFISPSDSANRSVVGNSNVVIGSKARATGASGLAVTIGPNASSGGAGAVTIGSGAASAGTTDVCIGSGSATTLSGVAIGGTVNAVAQGSVGVGQNSNAQFKYSVGLGAYAQPDMANEVVLSTGARAARGDSKTSILTQWVQTTNATPTELGVNGSGIGAPNTFMIVPVNTAWFFDVHVVANNASAAGNAFAQTFQFLGQCAATLATFQISSIISSAVQSIGTVTGWSVAITADTVTGGIKISVTGVAATNIDWTATIIMTKAA